MNNWIKLLTTIILIIFVVGNMRWNISINPLVEYSKNFNPCVDANQTHSHNTKNSNIEDPNGKIVYILNFRKIDVQYKQCVLLVYLKLYYNELRNGEFSAEVRKPLYLITRFNRESSFSKAYCEIVGENIFERTLGPEYLDASMAVNFIEKNPYLINNDISAVLNNINHYINETQNPAKSAQPSISITSKKEKVDSSFLSFWRVFAEVIKNQNQSAFKDISFESLNCENNQVITNTFIKSYF